MVFSTTPHDTQLRSWLTLPKTIAIIGLSLKPDRPSNRVARYLLTQGFTIIPVNPGQNTILDRICFPDITAVPGQIDIACIFRKSDQVPPIMQQAITKGVPLVWMQLGIINEKAAVLAQQHGIAVVMDRCLQVEHQRLFPSHC